MFAAMAHECRRDPDRAKADDPAEQMHRHPTTLGAVHLDHRVLPILVKPSSFSRHVECIQMPAHERGSVFDSFREPAIDRAGTAWPLRLTQLLE